MGYGQVTMDIYLAGPMTGHDHYNAPAFRQTQRRLEGAGHRVETPLDANSRVWQRHHGRDFDPYEDTCDYDDPLLREMMLEDLRVLLSSDAMAVLPGWRESTGVALEKHVADTFDIPVLDSRTLEPVDDETPLQEAQRLVHGDRNEDYGHPLDDFARTGKLWAPILDAHRDPGEPVPPEAVALCMAQVKVSRECNRPKRDNRVDLAGYAETAHMVHEERARRDG